METHGSLHSPPGARRSRATAFGTTAQRATPLPPSAAEVHAGSSGAGGLKVIKQVRPDLIILDVMMDTVTEGIYVSYEIRSQDPKSEYHEFSRIPIIMLTAISQKMGMKFSPEKDGEYLPIDEFVEKPIRIESLLEKVKKLLPK